MTKLAAALLVALALVPGAAGERAATKPLLGIKGDVARFKAQTGQESVVRHALLGWGQGHTYGSRFRALLPDLAPVPMIHLGTKRGNRQVVTPRDIALGRGDDYLRAINQAISEWGRLIYLRPMAEMNGHWNVYSAFNRNGTPRGPSHTTAWFRKMFARIYVIAHGGTAAQVNAKLRGLGLPPVAGGDLAVNRYPTLRVVWNPQGYGSPDIRGNSAQAYYPGDAYVDVVGNDLYDQNFKAEWAANEALYRAHPRKPYSFPEWGLWGVDDPAFVQRMCDFIRTHPRVEMAAYFEAVPGSVFDLATKPKSRAVYKRCITPLGGPAPAGGGGGTPARGTPPTPATLLRLSADPAQGPAPLDVVFSLESNVPRAAEWQLILGDGTVRRGTGAPPDTIDHSYAREGVYDVVLVVYQAPPFTGTAIRFLTRTQVRVGEDAGVTLALTPNVRAGKAPLAVSFRTVANLDRVVKWQFLPGDGSVREGPGKPPRFLGFTYKQRGAYRAILIVYLAPQFTGTAARLITFADIRVS